MISWLFRPSRRAGVAVLAGLLAARCSPVESVPEAASATATRIVPASATAVDLVAALVAPERIAGLPAQALEYSTLEAAGAALATPTRFDVYAAEPVLALRPDLVVIDPWQAPETTARLREAGVRVRVLPEIATWPEARAALDALGHELGASERARALIRELDQQVALLQQAAQRRPVLRALCYSNFGAAGSSAGARTTVDEMFRIAGLVNLVAQAGHVGHVALGFEDLLTLDPDVIVTSQPLRMGAGHAGDRGGASEQLLYEEPTLAGLRAVRERRVIALPAWLFATGSHEIVRGAGVLADEVERLLARLEREGAR